MCISEEGIISGSHGNQRFQAIAITQKRKNSNAKNFNAKFIYRCVCN